MQTRLWTKNTPRRNVTINRRGSFGFHPAGLVLLRSGTGLRGCQLTVVSFIFFCRSGFGRWFFGGDGWGDNSTTRAEQSRQQRSSNTPTTHHHSNSITHTKPSQPSQPRAAAGAVSAVAEKARTKSSIQRMAPKKSKPTKAPGRPWKKPHPKILKKIKEEKQAALKQVYSIVHKSTGMVGGNGSGGPCYGELTPGGMQRVVDHLVEYTALSKKSMVVDIGCGRGKPNLHFAQDPGVQFSCGIEIEPLRTSLGHINVQGVLKAAVENESLGTSCVLQQGDITAAGSFDPFTHVYQFDVAVSLSVPGSYSDCIHCVLTLLYHMFLFTSHSFSHGSCI